MALKVTVEALTTVQVPAVAVQVPSKANNCAGKEAVRLTLCATAAPLLMEAETPTMPPGPKQIAGSVMLADRLPTLSVAEAVLPCPPLVEVTLPVVLFFVPTVVPVTLTLIVHELPAASVPPARLSVPAPALDWSV